MSLFASLGQEDVDDSLWGDGGLFSQNPVQDILDREEGFTLEELLEEDELIQEVKHLNTKLIAFLSQRSTVAQLVTYVVRDDTRDELDVMEAATVAEEAMAQAASANPSDATEKAETATAETGPDTPAFMQGMPQNVMAVLHEREKLGRFAYTASEIFCCEVPGVNCHLVEDAATVAKRKSEGGDGSCDTTPQQLPGGMSMLVAAASATEDANGDANGEEEKNSATVEKAPTTTTTTTTIDDVPTADAPLIAQFFHILHRPVLSPRTAGYLEKIVDLFLQREQDPLMNWVDQHPELLHRFIVHLGSISVSNVFRKLLDATDRQPPPTPDDDDDVPPGPASSFDMSTVETGRRILWQGQLGPSSTPTNPTTTTDTTTDTTTTATAAALDPASAYVVETILKVFTESGCEDDKYVSAGDALIDCVNRSTAQETILSLQSDEPPRNTPTSLMVALNTTTTANALMSAAVSADTSKCAVQGCLSVLVRLIEWHAQNLQFEADARLPTETMSDDDSSDDSSDDRGATTRMEAKTPRSSGTGDTFHYCR